MFVDVERLLYRNNGERILTRKIANHTYLERCPTGVQLRLHRTAVITWHRDDTITVRTDGWYTMTTKERINAWLPHRGRYIERRDENGGYLDGEWVGLRLGLYSARGFWYVETARGERAFHDGMQFDLRTCTEFTPKHDNKAEVRHNIYMHRKIENYLRHARWMPDGSPQLPLSCHGSSEGDELRAWLLREMEQPTYTAALLFRVATDRHYRNPSLIAAVWVSDPKNARPAVRRWMRARLYLGAHGVRTAGVCG